MKKVFFIACLAITFLAAGAKAQNAVDSIYMVKKFMGIRFVQHDEILAFNQLPELMQDNQAAFEKIRKAKGNNTAASIISGVGGFLIGLNLGTALIGGDPNWTYSGIGAGLIVVSIPFSTKARRQALEAVDLYNADLSARRPGVQFYAGVTGNGIGIRMAF